MNHAKTKAALQALAGLAVQLRVASAARGAPHKEERPASEAPQVSAEQVVRPVSEALVAPRKGAQEALAEQEELLDSAGQQEQQDSVELAGQQALVVREAQAEPAEALVAAVSATLPSLVLTSPAS